MVRNTLLCICLLIINVVQGKIPLAFASEMPSGKSEIPQLPPVDPNNKDIPTIKLGESIRFEEYGPIILNKDGTTRRIANWDQMTEQERAVTWRRISKRNEERRQILLEQAKEAEGKNEEL